MCDVNADRAARVESLCARRAAAPPLALVAGRCRARAHGILAAVPLALVGVVALLSVTSTTLSAPVMLGVILLVGIVVNNAILLVEYVEIGRRQQGLSPLDAVIEAGRVRFLPI